MQRADKALPHCAYLSVDYCDKASLHQSRPTFKYFVDIIAAACRSACILILIQNVMKTDIAITHRYILSTNKTCEVEALFVKLTRIIKPGVIAVWQFYVATRVHAWVTTYEYLLTTYLYEQWVRKNVGQTEEAWASLIKRLVQLLW